MTTQTIGYGFRHPQKRAFLAAYRQTGNIRAATEAAGVDRTTFYKWTENDLVFAAAARQAKEEFGDLLEAKLSQMAMRQDNVTALIVALKMAGRFVERVDQRTEHSGAVGVSRLSQEQRAAVAQALLGS